MTDPTVIQLNSENSFQFLVQYIELAQKAGAYELQESNILKRSIDVLISKVTDTEISEENAKLMVIRGILKGQKSGVYTLNDASLLHQVITFINKQPQEPTQVIQESIREVHKKLDEKEETDDFDLSELSENVPLVV